MKNKLSKAIALTLTCGIVSSASVLASEIKVYIDEKQVNFDVQPIIYEDRTLVPLRAIFEALGAEVSWDQNTRTASAVRGEDTMSITIDSKQLFKNNKAVELDVPAMIVNDRTLVPVRAISESFDCDVQWDEATQTVNITTTTEPEATAVPTASPSPSPTAAPRRNSSSHGSSTSSSSAPSDTSNKLQLSEKDTETMKAQKDNIRYEYEQINLPEYMFENSGEIYDMLADTNAAQFEDNVFYEWDRTVSTYLIRTLIDSETEYTIGEESYNDGLLTYFEDAIKSAGLNKESMFEGVKCFEHENGTRIGVVTFKTSDAFVQCKYLGIASAKGEKPRYFTAENDILETDKWFLGEVTESGRGTIVFFDKKDEQTDLQTFVNLAAEAYKNTTK